PWARMRQIVTDGPLHQQERPGIVGCEPPYLPLAMRPDVLVFQTEPLPEAVEVTGAALVHLWISSSALDTDFTAKLIDVYPPSEDYPDGYAMNLADGILRTHYRNGYSKPEMIKPGEVYEISIPMFATSKQFTKNHRIRVEVS